MRVVVTGGAGYLGCLLVPALLEKGHEVRLFDRFCYGDGAIESFISHPKCEIVRGDIRRLQEFPELLDGVEGTIHLAGLSNDPSCDLDPEVTLDVNVESARELASRAVQAGVRRFVFASSCSIYGGGVFNFLDEESPANPVSAYSSSMLKNEREFFAMKSETFEPVALRMGTLFGVSPRMRFDLAVNQMAATAMRRGVINVLGGGNQWRPFLHVRDAARAFIEFLEAPADIVSGEAYNLGSDDANLQIIHLAKRVAARCDGANLDVAPDDADRRDYRVSFAKMRDAVDFECEVTVDEGIDEIKTLLADDSFDPFSNAYFNVLRVKELRETPVDEGGEPIAPRFIALAKPVLGMEEEDAVLSTFRSGWLTSGPHIQAFEDAFKATVEAEHVIAVASCTAALHLCLVQAGVGAGDEVITSPITWASPANTILNMGARVVFADIDPATLNISPRAVEAAITDRTRVIMPVHMAGQPCDLDAIYAIGRKHGISIVEDAAHGLGASYRGKPIGSMGEFACFSFYAIKNITTMEGGTIAVRDSEAAARLRALAANGMTANAWDRYGRSAVPAPPEVVEPGFKYLMGNVSAAMGLEQLKKFPKFKAARRRLARMYRSALSEIEELSLLDIAEDVEHSWHLMIVRLDLDRLSKNRDEVAFALRQENVGTGVHFLGLHLHKYYRETLGLKPEDFPQATSASRQVLSLPLYPGLSDKNVHEVVAALKKVIAHAR
jgi:dTDP-4-amino-4,6-dideoxygalactose transaminase/nucleoside-diphosphate-sugar epimerase